MTRNYYFDNMKAFLIFLVVLGHMISGFFGDGSDGSGSSNLCDRCTGTGTGSVYMDLAKTTDSICKNTEDKWIIYRSETR